MSSHHFVKEGQEPLLLVVNAHGQSQKMLEQLLSWSPKMVVLEPCIHQMEAFGFKMDQVLVTKQHKEMWMSTLAYQWPIDVTVLPQLSVTMSIQALVAESGHPDLHVFIKDEAELYACINDMNDCASNCEIRVFGDDFEAYPLKKSGTTRFFPNSTTLSVKGCARMRDQHSEKMVRLVDSEPIILEGDGVRTIVPEDEHTWLVRKLTFSF